jgi:hypothetical protein
MDVVERSRAFCSSFNQAWPPIGLLGFLRGIDSWSLLMNHWILWWLAKLTNCSDSWLSEVAAQGDSLAVAGWLSATTMCSGSLVYLLARPGRSHGGGYGWLVNHQLPSGLSPGLEGRWWGAIQLVSSLKWLTLEELVFLHCWWILLYLCFCCDRKLVVVPYEIQLWYTTMVS